MFRDSRARARCFSSGMICIERRHSIKDNEESQREKEEYGVHFVKAGFIAADTANLRIFSVSIVDLTELNRVTRPLLHIP